WLGLRALLVLVGGIVALKWFLQEPRRTSAAGQATLAPMQLDVQYEKVMATSTNIFRYDLSLRQGRISVRIDNLDNARHIPPKEQQVDAKVLESLAASLDNSGFFDLQPEYAGLAPDILESYDLTITLGRRTQRCRVVNRVEPEAFAKARVMVEEFAHNELHLAALAQTPEKLLELAQNAMLQGQKLYDEIGIKYANLSEAMKAFNEADICLESIDPKPDFYGKIIAGREDCKRKLQELYDDRAFRAERAIKLRDWKEASNQLRIILELIPEREDTRNQQAQVKLLDVERHLDKKR
ncbi:MAG: hypothetical protein NTV49_04470, partial [Kiritimatiellaeota bacterium]|nr:hypothetical protein [Kiritimatiellota bacterium]